MTVCIAALADDRRTLILFADKMIGAGAIQSELSSEKILPVHTDWHVMFSGNNIAPVFNIVDRVKHRLGRHPKVPIGEAIQVFTESYNEERLQKAEKLYLKTVGLTLKQFYKEGPRILPESVRLQKLTEIDKTELGIDLLVAGFDGRRMGHIFIVTDPGIETRCDIPGFAAIGSGGGGAAYMMYWRDLSPQLRTREVLCYAFEGKWFGEEAPGVGEKTDGYVLRPTKRAIRLDLDKTIEKVLVPICKALDPSDLRDRDIAKLNEISELSSFPSLPRKKKMKRKKG